MSIKDLLGVTGVTIKGVLSVSDVSLIYTLHSVIL